MENYISLGSDVDDLLDSLYAQSNAQAAQLVFYFTKRAEDGSLDWNGFDEDANRFLSNKLVALDREKAEFCYQICRALRAKRVVEAGTSFGVSTLYLAAAVRDNVQTDGGDGVVIGTEYEPEKVRAARANFEEAGLTKFIDLRQGDLRTTLIGITGPIDFVLMDIWTPMARPALELVAPHLRNGAVVISDNTAQYANAYAEYFDFINDPANKFCTTTLPFDGGLEFTVRIG